MKNKRILITAGPTQEAIDPVRYLSNYSSGKQGYAIAKACIEMGAEEVVLISGPTQLEAPQGVQFMRVKTAEEMLAACEMALPVDIAIFTAAVCDWRPKHTSTEKLKKQDGQDELTIEFVKNPDILQHISIHANRPHYVIGFAAETEYHVAHAAYKLKHKQCDAMVLNDVSVGSGTFGGENTHLQLLLKGQDHAHDLGEGTKEELATKLLVYLSETIFCK